MVKNVVVTGGTKGIGKAIVERFLQGGFRVFTCGSSKTSVSDLRTELSRFATQFEVEVVDVRKKDELRQWSNKVMEHGPIYMLVNNAGRFIPGSIAGEPEDAFEEMIATNLSSAYHATRSFLAGFGENGGFIFNICSTASITAYTNGGSYCISKFGLLGLSKVLREELKPRKIKVTSILPGATLTDSWAGTELPKDRFMQPEDIAAIVWNATQLSAGTVLEEILLRPLQGDIG